MNRKPYVQKQSASWWLANKPYRFYMLREASAVPIFLYVLLLMWGVLSLGRGEADFTQWLQYMSQPMMQAFQLLVLAAALLHVYTWFALTPKILVLRIGEKRVADAWIMLAHYAGFVVCSIALIGLAICGLQG